jgi:CRISPR-associated endonuclease/helicase Cas3
MHVFFVSACEKRALKKTRAVLDSFALRTGEKAWVTPITAEGLHEVRTALKRVATRQTAVACYRNEGRQRMKLLWIVGSRNAFGPDGHFPAAYRLAQSSSPVAAGMRVAALLAQAAGWGHDFGKASTLFQAKLRVAAPIKDSVRHEWVSMRLLQSLRAGKTWDEAWPALTSLKQLQRLDLEKGLQSAADALDYLVVTHHRLLGPKQSETEPDASNHFSGAPVELAPAAALSSKPFEAVQSLLERIEKQTEGGKPPAYWRAVSVYARAALIMADHTVSARNYTGKASDGPLFANTKGQALDQPLEWHLNEVAHAASDFAYRIGTLRLPGLSEQSVEAICRPAGHACYQWQDRAADALAAFRRESEVPMLALNMASTGSGKTRMNARAACVLAQDRVRFAVALNLRALTLQTGDAYRGQLGIGADELACIIGDRITQRLHSQGAALATPDDADENEAEAEFEATLGEFEMPAWLEAFASGKRHFKTITGAPILISTIDFLIAAGMPHRQGHHVAALLRLIDSDLVLDEVDGYDPKPLVAVLRLVQMAALFGRNVICSTATLAEPVAQAVYQAYLSGAELRAALQGAAAPTFACGLFDNSPLAVEIFRHGSGQAFEAIYRQRIERQRQKSTQAVERLPYLQTVAERTVAAWQQAVLAAVRRLHGDHAWRHSASGKRISFGLVRMANIQQAIETAKFLAAEIAHAKVACYHSQDFLIQRFLKEQTLDRLLCRHAGNQAIESDPDIRETLAASPFEEILFIVVATPVEEIGRDHDFDWAVIEPSSTRSLVQTAGRVNRHRHAAIQQPNIALLQYNHRWARGENIVFCKPGYESADCRHDSHDLQALLNWPLASLDAGLMFDGHRFAKLDNLAIEAELKKPLRRQFDLAAKPWWLTEALYEAYPLRERERRDSYFLDEEGRLRLLDAKAGISVDRDADFRREPALSNDWLAFADDALLARCEEFDLPVSQGMRVNLPVYGDGAGKWIWNRSFGFSRLSAKS